MLRMFPVFALRVLSAWGSLSCQLPLMVIMSAQLMVLGWGRLVVDDVLVRMGAQGCWSYQVPYKHMTLSVG